MRNGRLIWVLLVIVVVLLCLYLYAPWSLVLPNGKRVGRCVYESQKCVLVDAGGGGTALSPAFLRMLLHCREQ